MSTLVLIIRFSADTNYRIRHGNKRERKYAMKFTRWWRGQVENFRKKIVVIISDCRDDNARARLMLEALRTIPGVKDVIFYGVQNDTEAAAAIVDVLARLDQHKSAVLLVNVAPRDEMSANGSAFGLIRHGKTLIFSTVQGYALQLLQKVWLTSYKCDVYDIATAVRSFHDLSEGQRVLMARTQFRSLEFLPYVAREILLGTKVPSETQVIQAPRSDDYRVCWVDNFGNIKTTILPRDINFRVGTEFRIEINGKSMWVKGCQLISDVESGELCLKVGSSGIDMNRFLEILCRNGNAAEVFNVQTGQKIIVRDRLLARNLV